MSETMIQSVNLPHATSADLRIVGFAVPSHLADGLLEQLERAALKGMQSEYTAVDVLADTVAIVVRCALRDTARLEHLLTMDHAVMAPAAGDQAPVERIDFIYDAQPGMSKLDALRAAIDNSIAASPKVICGLTDAEVEDYALTALVNSVRPLVWQRDNEAVLCALLLTSVAITPEAIAAWSDEQARLAQEWAIALHYHASDNDNVVVPPRPSFLDAASTGGVI